jgi:hypothetical protein
VGRAGRDLDLLPFRLVDDDRIETEGPVEVDAVSSLALSLILTLLDVADMRATLKS